MVMAVKETTKPISIKDTCKNKNLSIEAVRNYKKKHNLATADLREKVLKPSDSFSESLWDMRFQVLKLENPTQLKKQVGRTKYGPINLDMDILELREFITNLYKTQMTYEYLGENCEYTIFNGTSTYVPYDGIAKYVLDSRARRRKERDDYLSDFWDDRDKYAVSDTYNSRLIRWIKQQGKVKQLKSLIANNMNSKEAVRVVLGEKDFKEIQDEYDPSDVAYLLGILNRDVIKKINELFPNHKKENMSYNELWDIALTATYVEYIQNMKKDDLD